MVDAVRYFTDQHLPQPVVEGLKRRGIDVLTAHEADRCTLPDIDQLEFAKNESRVIVTFDSDFLDLHDAGHSHHGIAWCPATKYGIGELVQMLVLLHAVLTPDDMKDHVEHL